MQFLYVEDICIPQAKAWAEKLTHALKRDFAVVSSQDFNPEEEADIYFFAVPSASRRVQHFLILTRPFRAPYFFLTPAMLFPTEPVLHDLLAPVTMLEEEAHKADLISFLANHTKAEIHLLLANDYGSRAGVNKDKILTFLHTREGVLRYTFDVHESTAKSDSFKLYKEVMEQREHQLVVWTASRDYGLDDLLFGPPERKLILRSHVPVALINPRGDLYSLCD